MDDMDDALPTESDFVVHGDLDEQAACRHFLGRTRGEVRALLEENFLYYQEDFMFMGAPAFCFYVSCLLEHAEAAQDEDVDRMTERACAFQIEGSGAEALRPCAALVAEALGAMALRLASRDADAARRAEGTRARYLNLARGDLAPGA